MSMSRHDKKALTVKAEELGFTVVSLEKMLRLIDILQQINRDPLLKDSLALKGGTAINIAVFNLPRLSHDIDLDLDLPCSRDEMIGSRATINQALGELMAEKGYELRSPRSKNTHALDSFYFSYVNAGGGADALRVELNYSMRNHLLPTIYQSVDELLDGSLGPLRVHTLHPIEIFASKINTLFSRAMARDMYDLNNMIYYGLFDESELLLLRKCAVFYCAVGGRGREFSLDQIGGITDYTVKTQLLPMIRKGERFDYTAAQKRVKVFISEYLCLDEKDKLFLSYFARGQYKPELLFADQEIVDRVKNHPMALWRIKNSLRRHSRER